MRLDISVTNQRALDDEPEACSATGIRSTPAAAPATTAITDGDGA
jgi:hypothetical protein